MSRLAVLAFALVAASVSGCSCGSSSSGQGSAAVAPPVEGGRIAVPGGAPTGADRGGPTIGGGTAPDDPRFHLLPQEGTLTIDNVDATAGTEATAGVKLAPAAGYHISTDYPIKLVLEPPAGVKLAKTELVAGGRDKAQGDADALSEKGLAFSVKATADKAGAYEINGTFKFGVCDKDSCHPKKQPIKIQVAAK